MIYVMAYVLCVVMVNYAFMVVPMISLPNGDLWSPVALLVGFVFVIRDYAQREVGHWVLPAMLIGGIISWFMASPQIASASICAFLVGEFLDWAVYTFTGRPFSQRVLLSSAASTPVDSAVFLYMIGMFSVSAVLVMAGSKMLGALAVFIIASKRDRLISA